jgi:cerevisin
MRFFAAVFTAFAIAASVFGAPSNLLTVRKYNGQTSGKYIVGLKKGASVASVTGNLRKPATHNWEIINAFAGMSPLLSRTLLEANFLFS